MRLLQLIGLLFVLLFAIVWPFYSNHFAVDKENKFRVLANGWVSIYPEIHLQKNLSVTQKIKQTISADLVHGRFRPAFFFYVTSSYALSPLIHGRSAVEEKRSYNKLISGDLLLFSSILLATFGISLVFMSLLIYKYTKEYIFSFIPIFFIPLSQTFLSNLISGMIDSQEIPMIFCLSAWFFFFFTAMIMRRRSCSIIYAVLSLIFLFFAFLIKETAVIAIPLVFIIFTVYMYKKNMYPSNMHSINYLLLLVTSLISLLCSSLVIFMVLKYRQGYGAGYTIENYNEIKKATELLWKWFSEYSLHNIYGYIPILLFFGIAIKEREKKILKIPIIQHALLLVCILLFCYGFYFILIPWNSLGPKYVLPSVFLFSFAVALSLSLITAWAKERHAKKGLLVYLSLFFYIIFYISSSKDSAYTRKYIAELSNYGTSVASPLAGSIANDFFSKKIGNLYVFIDYGTNVVWANDIPFGWLHLMRILNLEKKINLMDQNGREILNYHMPTAELSSFRKYNNNKKLYISREPKELSFKRFNVVYQGYKSSEKPLEKLNFSKVGVSYKRSGDCIHYQSDTKLFPEFFYVNIFLF